MRILRCCGSQILFWLGTASLLLLCSCFVTADHSFLDPGQCYVDDTILGHWAFHDDDLAKPANAIYEFRRTADGRSLEIFLLEFNGEDDKGETRQIIASGRPIYRAWVSKIKGQELFCVEHLLEGGPTPQFMLFRMSRPDRAIIVLQELEQPWVDDQLEHRKLRLTSESSGGMTSDTRLVATTEQLQPLVRRAIHDPKAFSDHHMYLFRTTAPQNASTAQIVAHP